ncbi:MAG: hypothetical protein GY913_18320, partial [Proteobacteria bacterium]|nr:hypothetical protein [Pseudomonadota bacterium]
MKDVVWAAGEQVVVALGGHGLRVYDGAGSLRHSFDVRADTLVTSPRGDLVLVLGRGRHSCRVSKLELATGQLRPWGSLGRVRACAQQWTEAGWVVSQRNRLWVVDPSDSEPIPRAKFAVPGREVRAIVQAGGDAALVRGTPEGSEVHLFSLDPPKHKQIIAVKLQSGTLFAADPAGEFVWVCTAGDS